MNNIDDTAPKPPVQADSGFPASDTPADRTVCAVAAIRATINDADVFDDLAEPVHLALEQIDQLLDRVMFVTDADIPLYLRTAAQAARHHGQDDVARVLDVQAESISKGLHERPVDKLRALNEIVKWIGDLNVLAGWWTDASTDLRTVAHAPHIFAGKMMLVVSEVSEAMEGHRKSKASKIMMDDHLTHRPMVEVEFADAIIRLFDLAANYRLPNGMEIDVPGALIEKIAYNQERADHKPEARAAEGGKTI